MTWEGLLVGFALGYATNWLWWYWNNRHLMQPKFQPPKVAQAPKARVLTDAEVAQERVIMRERLAAQYGPTFTDLGTHAQSAMIDRLTKEARQLLGGGR